MLTAVDFLTWEGHPPSWHNVLASGFRFFNKGQDASVPMICTVEQNAVAHLFEGVEQPPAHSLKLVGGHCYIWGLLTQAYLALQTQNVEMWESFCSRIFRCLLVVVIAATDNLEQRSLKIQQNDDLLKKRNCLPFQRLTKRMNSMKLKKS